MIEKNLKPKLRFPEFNTDWKEITLSEILSFKNGINASKEDYGRGYKFINVLDIIQNKYITHDIILGSVDVSEEEFNKNIVEYGDILFQRSSETREEVGQANVYMDKEYPATFGGFVIRGKRIADYDPIFINELLKTSRSRNEITSKSGGSTRYNVGQDTLSKVSIFLTELPEQQKIASFLSAIDKRIQLLEEKKKLLERYKDGVMQTLFPKKGEKLPEIRFKDENGNNFPDWAEKDLGELADIVKGKQLNKVELTDIGNYPCQNGGIEPSGYTDTFNTPENTITISEGGNSCGYVNFMTTKFWCGGHCYALINLNANISNDYLFQYLKQFQNEIMRLRVGSGLPNIQKGDIISFKVGIPSIKEQKKISKFLSTLDDIIEKIDLEFKVSINFKKGLLQKLFV